MASTKIFKRTLTIFSFSPEEGLEERGYGRARVGEAEAKAAREAWRTAVQNWADGVVRAAEAWFKSLPPKVAEVVYAAHWVDTTGIEYVYGGADDDLAGGGYWELDDGSTAEADGWWRGKLTHHHTRERPGTPTQLPCRGDEGLRMYQFRALGKARDLVANAAERLSAQVREPEEGLINLWLHRERPLLEWPEAPNPAKFRFEPSKEEIEAALAEVEAEKAERRARAAELAEGWDAPRREIYARPTETRPSEVRRDDPKIEVVGECEDGLIIEFV